MEDLISGLISTQLQQPTVNHLNKLLLAVVSTKASLRTLLDLPLLKDALQDSSQRTELPKVGELLNELATRCKNLIYEAEDEAIQTLIAHCRAKMLYGVCTNEFSELLATTVNCLMDRKSSFLDDVLQALTEPRLGVAQLRQRARLGLYCIVLQIMEQAPDALTNGQVLGISANEKDPRNILTVFKIYHLLLDSVEPDSVQANSLFEQLESYYPIEFLGETERSDIDLKAIASVLDSCLCHRALVGQTIKLLQQKIVIPPIGQFVPTLTRILKGSHWQLFDCENLLLRLGGDVYLQEPQLGELVLHLFRCLCPTGKEVGLSQYHTIVRWVRELFIMRMVSNDPSHVGHIMGLLKVLTANRYPWVGLLSSLITHELVTYYQSLKKDHACKKDSGPHQHHQAEQHSGDHSHSQEESGCCQNKGGKPKTGCCSSGKAESGASIRPFSLALLIPLHYDRVSAKLVSSLVQSLKHLWSSLEASYSEDPTDNSNNSLIVMVLKIGINLNRQCRDLSRELDLLIWSSGLSQVATERNGLLSRCYIDFMISSGTHAHSEELNNSKLIQKCHDSYSGYLLTRLIMSGHQTSSKDELIVLLSRVVSKKLDMASQLSGCNLQTTLTLIALMGQWYEQRTSQSQNKIEVTPSYIVYMIRTLANKLCSLTHDTQDQFTIEQHINDHYSTTIHPIAKYCLRYYTAKQPSKEYYEQKLIELIQYIHHGSLSIKKIDSQSSHQTQAEAENKSFEDRLVRLAENYSQSLTLFEPTWVQLVYESLLGRDDKSIIKVQIVLSMASGLLKIHRDTVIELIKQVVIGQITGTAKSNPNNTDGTKELNSVQITPKTHTLHSKYSLLQLMGKMVINEVTPAHLDIIMPILVNAIQTYTANLGLGRAKGKINGHQNSMTVAEQLPPTQSNNIVVEEDSVLQSLTAIHSLLSHQPASMQNYLPVIRQTVSQKKALLAHRKRNIRSVVRAIVSLIEWG